MPTYITEFIKVNQEERRVKSILNLNFKRIPNQIESVKLSKEFCQFLQYVIISYWMKIYNIKFANISDIRNQVKNECY